MLIVRFFRVLKTAGFNWVTDQAAQMGAALAYYTLFSFAPLLFIALFITGQIYGDAAARGEVVDKIRGFIGDDSASAVQTMLENFHRPQHSGPAAIVGIASLIFGSLGVFTQLRTSLNRIWGFKAHEQRFLIGLLKDYLLAFVMVLVTSVFFLALLTASAFLNFLIEWARDLIPGDAWAWRLADFLISSWLITLLFAFTYRFMSEGHIRYADIWIGAIISAVLFSIGKMVIGFYLGYTHLASAFGAAGSLVVFLAWVYYSAQIFFFGAEIIRVRHEALTVGLKGQSPPS